MALFPNKINIGEFLLGILFLIYLLTVDRTPPALAKMVDHVYGKAVVILIALLLFVSVNPVLGVLGFVVAVSLIKNSQFTGTGLSPNLAKYVPTEKKKFTKLTEYNQFPYTLEQEVVSQMAPLNSSDSSATYEFNPVLDDQHDAAPLNYNGVI
jgi:hypothetical protein